MHVPLPGQARNQADVALEARRRIGKSPMKAR